MSFTTKENIELLWSVLLEESNIKNINKNKQENVYNAFYNNVLNQHGFFYRHPEWQTLWQEFFPLHNTQ